MDTKIVALAVFAALSSTAANATGERSASWFADHPRERAGVLHVCREYASQGKSNPNCQNAFQGSLEASARNAGRNYNVSKADIDAWRDPKNAETLAFWGKQCRVAEAQGRPPEVLHSLKCHIVKASGGY